MAWRSRYAQSVDRAGRADSFEAWRLLDESATAAAALPYTCEAYPSFQLRLYDTDHIRTKSASVWHCGYASIVLTVPSSLNPLKNGCRNFPSATWLGIRISASNCDFTQMP